MPQQITDQLSNADATPEGIDGGLNLKADPTRLAPPATTRSDNAHYDGIGNVSQLPGFVSSGLNNARHVYNLHAKDIANPSSSGDVLVHGEYPDGANGYTVPAWAHNNGTSPSLNQPVLPFTAKTRFFSSRFRTDNTVLWNDQTSIQFARQEGNYAEGQRVYAALDNNTRKLIAGRCNGLTVSATASIVDTSTPVELVGIQNTGNFAAVWATGGSLYLRTFSPTLQNLGTQTVSTSVLATLDDGHLAIQCFNHAGATFVAFVTSGSKVVTLYDITNGVTINTNITAGTINGPFAVFSPYTHTAQSQACFLCVIVSGYLHVLCRATPSTNPYVYVNAVLLPVASQQPSNSVKYVQATGAAIVNDSQNGVGGNAKLLITVFRSYPEASSGFTGMSNYSQNAISVDQYAFTAAATPTSGGSLTALQQTILRPPGGAICVSRAFTSNPPETFSAGAVAAKQALCLIKQGAWEATGGGNTYGQPTYYLVDQGGRVCGRFCEGRAYTTGTIYAKDGGTTNTAQALADNRLGNLATPLFLLGSDAGLDNAAFSIVLPVMSLTDASVYPPIGLTSSFVVATTQPNNPVWTPTAITLTLPSANNSVPAVQAGPYTSVSGALTCIHDGGQVVEANYHVPCPNLIVIPLTSGTQRGAAGVYYYVGVFEWRDELGQLHRSAPSNPAYCYRISPFYGATVYCPFPITSKPYNNLVFKLYRSVLNRVDNNYYLVSTATGAQSSQSFGMFTGGYDAVFNDSAPLTSAAPNPSDTNALTAQARMYANLNANSTANVYFSQMPPPFFYQIAHRGRLFGLSQVGGQTQLYYSSPTAQALAPEWNLLNFLPIPPDLGDARSIEALDSQIFVFGTRYNMAVAGDGPPTSNAAGVPNPGDGYAQLTPIPTPAGVIGSGSPSRVPDGLVFQGYSGIQMIDRSGQVQPVGMPVDVLTGRQTGNQGTIYGRAITLPSLQSVVWPNANGPALVYSYLTKKFSTWPLLANACTFAQKMDGTIVAALQPILANQYQGPANSTTLGCDIGTLQASAYAPIYAPNPAGPGLVIETPWILPHGTSGGEARVVNGCLTGTWQGPHLLQIEQAYDYEPYSLTRTVDFSTAPRRYQVIAQPRANTRCVAIRFRFTLLPVTTLGAGYLMATLSDFVLFSAQQQGTTRTSANLRS